MKRIVVLFVALSLSVVGCANLGETLKAAIDKEVASKKMPAELIGTWESKGYLTQRLTINEKEFTLQINNREGKLWQTYAGPMRNVDTRKNFLAPAISAMTQDGENMERLLKNGGPYVKIMYYKNLTADSVQLYIDGTGLIAEKDMNRNEEESKLDRHYEAFTRSK